MRWSARGLRLALVMALAGCSTEPPPAEGCKQSSECPSGNTCVAGACTPTSTGNTGPKAGFVVTPTSGLITTEAGGSATFTVVLTRAPGSDVSTTVSPADPGEVTVQGSPTLIFTPVNWNVAQTVTLVGVDDFDDDGAALYTVLLSAAVSTDPAYSGVAPGDVSGTNTDNEEPGITVSPISGLITDESGTTATFSVRLNTPPTATVGIVLSVTGDEVSVTPTALSFTTGNSSVPQVVTVRGVDDALDDGDQPFTVVLAAATSTDLSYNSVNPPDVSGTNRDDDRGFTFSRTSGLATSEDGGTDTFTVVLDLQPTADVTLGFQSNRPEAVPNPGSLTFTSANWNVPRTVTLTGQNDAVCDGNTPFTIVTAAAVSADPQFSGKNPPDVAGVNSDDEVPAVTVSPTAGLITTEAGGVANFTMVLGCEPGAAVTLSVSSGDSTEGVVLPSSVTFTTADWETPKTFTVTGQDDVTTDGDLVYSIVTAPGTSTSPGYQGLDPDDVELTNTDDDFPEVRVTPTGGLTTTEAAGRAFFTVVLGTAPSASVTIPLTSSDTTEGRVSPASVIFSTTNWNVSKSVTVTGQDDDVLDGNSDYLVRTGPAVTSDPQYSADGGVDAPDVALTNLDNDDAGFAVNPTTNLRTVESGQTASFTVALTSQPAANVSIDVVSEDLSEAAVNPSRLTFTSGNWDLARTVTVTGVDDYANEGDGGIFINLGAASSSDLDYLGINPPDVEGENVDDDVPAFLVSPTTGLRTTEDGGYGIFTVVLSTQPTSAVGVTVTSSKPGEGVPSPAAFNFTTGNWDLPVTVTVTGLDDATVDGDQAFNLVVAAVADAGYFNLNPPDVAAINSDDDAVGIRVLTDAGISTTELATVSTKFTVVLTRAPDAGVSIPVVSSDTNEASASPASLVFTAANWFTPQTVTVTGVNDGLVDGDRPYVVRLLGATSADSSFNNLNGPDVPGINRDNDSAGVMRGSITTLIVSEVLPPAEFGTTRTFTLKLTAQPAAPVAFDLTVSDLTEGHLSHTSVTFTPVSWNTFQTITLTGVNDGTPDGNQPFTIITGPMRSADANFNGVDPADIACSNTNVD